MRWAIVCHVGQSILKFIGHSIVVHNSCLSNICQKINRLPFRKGTATLEGISPIIQCAQSIPVHISPSNALLMFFPRVQSIFSLRPKYCPPKKKPTKPIKFTFQFQLRFFLEGTTFSRRDIINLHELGYYFQRTLNGCPLPNHARSLHSYDN